MAGWDDIKQWDAGKVGDVGDLLVKAKKTVVGLQEEIDASATPKEWHGKASDAAKTNLKKHTDDLETIAAELGAMTEIVDVTEADVKATLDGIDEVETWAAKDEFAIDNGKVVDRSDDSGFTRDLAKLTLQALIDCLVKGAEGVDKDLRDVMQQVIDGEIDDDGAKSLKDAAKEGAEDVKLDEILEDYQQSPDPDGMVIYPPVVGRKMTAKEAEMLKELGIFGQQDMYLIKELAYGAAGKRFPDENDTDNHQDAFRHAYWNALMTQRFGEKWAKEYATAHESVPGNLPDAEAMDSYNNEVGRRIAAENPDATAVELATLIEEAVNNGEMVVIDKDGELQYSDEVDEGETGKSDDKQTEKPQEGKSLDEETYDGLGDGWGTT